MSVNHEQAVRQAAQHLRSALEAAATAGYRILGNVRPQQLEHVGLSGTAKSHPPQPETPAPKAPSVSELSPKPAASAKPAEPPKG
jgi:hypothetical protein